MAHRKSILVLESESLFAASITSLLASQAEFDVSSMQFDTLGSFDHPNGHQLDVIILEATQLAANITALMDLVDCHPQVRLIILRLDDKRLHIFDKQLVQVEQVSDFLATLQSRSA